jgi:hypothetical protein
VRVTEKSPWKHNEELEKLSIKTDGTKIKPATPTAQKAIRTLQESLPSNQKLIDWTEQGSTPSLCSHYTEATAPRHSGRDEDWRQPKSDWKLALRHRGSATNSNLDRRAGSKTREHKADEGTENLWPAHSGDNPDRRVSTRGRARLSRNRRWRTVTWKIKRENLPARETESWPRVKSSAETETGS